VETRSAASLSSWRVYRSLTGWPPLAVAAVATNAADILGECLAAVGGASRKAERLESKRVEVMRLRLEQHDLRWRDLRREYRREPLEHECPRRYRHNLNDCSSTSADRRVVGFQEVREIRPQRT